MNLEALDDTAQLEATARDQNGNTLSAQFSWDSSDSTIVSVNAAGLVTAINNGTATLTVRSGTVSASASVTVEQTPASIALSRDEIRFTARGQSHQLEASVFDANENAMSAELIWETSDSAVATVDEDGTITAQANGTATITVIVRDQDRSLSVSAEINVERPPLTVSGDPNVSDALGRTPLHAAAIANAPRLIAALVAAGADIEASDKDGYTALHAAAASNAPAAIAALAEAGADVSARDLDSFTPLLRAAASTASAAITALLAAGADANERDGLGRTPLHLAGLLARNWTIEIVQATTAALLEAGANPNARDDQRATPLHNAASVGNSLTMTAVLLEAGANPNLRMSPANVAGGWTPLRAWVSVGQDPDILAALLEAGTDIETRDDDGNSLLHLAAERDKPATVAALLEAGANLGARDPSGRTPLHAAAASTAVGSRLASGAAIAVLLEAGADPNARDDAGYTALQLAPGGSTGLITALMEAHAGGIVHDPNAHDAFGYSALHAAARANSPRLIAALVAAGADVDALDNDGYTPLLVAAGAKRRAGRNAPPRTSNAEAITALAEAGANLEARNDWGWSALHFAASAESDVAAESAVLSALIEAGADLQARDRNGWTALRMASWASHMAAIVTLAEAEPDNNSFAAVLALAANDPAPPALVEAGVNPNARDDRGQTVLHHAIRWHDSDALAALAALVEAGADLNAIDGNGDTPLHRAVQQNNAAMIAALVAAGADVEARDTSGRTALQVAAYNGEPDMVAALLEAGAGIEARDPRGRTALHFAAGRDFHGPAHTGFISTHGVIGVLLEAGADPDALDNFGNTPLHTAAEAGYRAATGILLVLGANWTSGSDTDPAEINVRVVAVELFQGPMVWQWKPVNSQAAAEGSGAGEGTVADHATTLLHRTTTMAVRIGSESPEPIPELFVSLSDADGRTWAAQAELAQDPQIVFLPGTSESGLWETEYVYELPAAWAESGHRATLAIDPYNRLDETDENDNTATLTMDGHAVEVFDVTFVPVVFSGDPPEIDTDTYMAVIGDLLPIGDYRAQVGRPLDLSDRNLGDSNVELSTETALNELLHRWNAEAAENEYYHGLLSIDEFSWGFGGRAFGSGKVAVSDAIYERCQPEREFCGSGVQAHELGHNFGVDHAPGDCDETEPIDHDYPYESAGVGPRRGWAASRNVFVSPGTFSPHYDVMSYCYPRFISDYNYNKMVNHRLGVTEQPNDSGRLGPSLEIGPSPTEMPSMTTQATRSLWNGPSPGAAEPSDGSGQGVATMDTVDEIGPSLAFTGAVDEFGLWSIMRIDASTRPPRLPSTGGEHFFTLLDADWQEIYREPMGLLTAVHGESPQAWAVRVPVPEQSPAFVAILDAQGTPVFIEPISAPPTADP